MTNEFDYIIIGAGPSGLSFAQMISKVSDKVLVVDRETEIGGINSSFRFEYYYLNSK